MHRRNFLPPQLLSGLLIASLPGAIFFTVPHRPSIRQALPCSGVLPMAISRHQSSLFASTTAPSRLKDTLIEEHDVVVIGSGIGGLSCASLCSATYGLDVAVVESHYHCGGAAHAFEIDGFIFDSGPSLFSGLSQDASPNPLLHVFQAIDEKVDWLTYNTWGVCLPYGNFAATIGPEPFRDILKTYGGKDAQEQWERFMALINPLSEAAMALPPSVLRNDPGVLLTMARFWQAVATTIPKGPQLQQPFSTVLAEAGVTDPFIRDWLSLLCFLLQGMTEEGTMTAVMAYMLADWYRPNVLLDYPRGGTGAVIDALVRGVTKTGGKVYTSAHVEEILIEGDRAVGVRLRSGKILRARRGVVSNASVWNTARLLPAGLLPEYQERVGRVSQTESFLHLHLGIAAEGLPGDLQCHYAVVDDFSQPINSPGNVVIISIPSLLDPSLAPTGSHTIHAYTAGNEPFALWEGLDRQGPDYKRLKEERSEILWRAIEKVIPDVRARIKLSLAGTPLTHARFLRRDRGTYGPAIRAGKDSYPSANPLPGLHLCGDSVFPGIGRWGKGVAARVGSEGLSLLISQAPLTLYA